MSYGAHEALRIRERMPTTEARGRSQVVVDVEVRRPGDVACGVALVTGLAGQRQPGVDDDHVGGDGVDVDDQAGPQHQDPNGSGSGESATARARAAVSRRRW